MVRSEKKVLEITKDKGQLLADFNSAIRYADIINRRITRFKMLELKEGEKLSVTLEDALDCSNILVNKLISLQSRTEALIE